MAALLLVLGLSTVLAQSSPGEGRNEDESAVSDEITAAEITSALFVTFICVINRK